MIKYGLQFDKFPKETDFKFGGINGIDKKVLEEGKDWTKYLPADEKQHSVYFDTMACATFSALNCLEILLNREIEKELMLADDFDFLLDSGYIEDFKVNFADRFTAKMSGTTKDGNYLKKVNDSIRKDGAVGERIWSYPRDQRTPVFNWDDYYSEIPGSVQALGKKFLERFTINYEVVYDYQFEEALKYGPIHVAVHAWEKPVDGVYQRTTKQINHAVTLIKKNTIYDHYDKFIKTVADDFIFMHYGYQFTITPKNIKKPMELQDGILYNLVEGPEAKVGFKLDNDLLINESESDKFNVIHAFVSRGGKYDKSSMVSVNLANWNSVPHINLKKQTI